MAQIDHSSLRAPISQEAVALTGGATYDTLLVPHGTRGVRYRFPGATGNVKIGGGDASDCVADTWYTEVFRTDAEHPLAAGAEAPISFNGSGVDLRYVKRWA